VRAHFYRASPPGATIRVDLWRCVALWAGARARSLTLTFLRSEAEQ
jgi:hypothetical protein